MREFEDWFRQICRVLSNSLAVAVHVFANYIHTLSIVMMKYYVRACEIN